MHPRLLHASAIATATALLCACGGNGSAYSGTDTTQLQIDLPQTVSPAGTTLAPAASQAALASDTSSSGLYLSSYMNQKGLWTNGIPTNLPALSDVGVAFGHFDGSGHIGVFSSHKTYTTSPNSDTSATAAEATPARYTFWKWDDTTGTYAADPLRFKGELSASPCSDVRKFVVADFNSDGRSDIFVTCVGWSHAPYPGDTNRLVISQPDGRYDVQDVGGQARPYVSASAADLNGDGKVDVLTLTDSATEPLQVLVNDGNGHFTKETALRMPSIGAGYYALELADADGNGSLDLLVGGHELTARRPTQVFLNPGNNRFIDATPKTLPPATDAAGADVIDFTVTGGSTPRVWVLRAAHDSHAASRVLQSVTWSTVLDGSAAYHAVFTDAQGAANWIAPAQVGASTTLFSDDAAMSARMTTAEFGL